MKEKKQTLRGGHPLSRCEEMRYFADFSGNRFQTTGPLSEEEKKKKTSNIRPTISSGGKKKTELCAHRKGGSERSKNHRTEGPLNATTRALQSRKGGGSERVGSLKRRKKQFSPSRRTLVPTSEHGDGQGRALGVN